MLNCQVLTEKLLKIIVKNELNKLKTFDSSYYNGKSYFEEDEKPNYVIFQPLYKYFKVLPNTGYILSWKSKGLSIETIKSHTTSPVTKIDYDLIPTVSYSGTKTKLKFTASYLKQDKSSYNHGKIVNIYIVYDLGAVTLTTNTDIDKYGYSGYGIGFDRRGSFSFPGGGFGQNILIFGADMSSSVHIDNKK